MGQAGIKPIAKLDVAGRPFAAIRDDDGVADKVANGDLLRSGTIEPDIEFWFSSGRFVAWGGVAIRRLSCARQSRLRSGAVR